MNYGQKQKILWNFLKNNVFLKFICLESGANFKALGEERNGEWGAQIYERWYKDTKLGKRKQVLNIIILSSLSPTVVFDDV